MSLAYEGNTDLAFNTEELRACGDEYYNVAMNLRSMLAQINECIIVLKETGWTTEAGEVFAKIVNSNWSDNIKKYILLLENLKIILYKAADKYDCLVTEDIDKIQI